MMKTLDVGLYGLYYLFKFVLVVIVFYETSWYAE